MSRRPHPDGGPDISTDPPIPPPFKVGTRLRYHGTHQSWRGKPGAKGTYQTNPQDWVMIVGPGIEVTIDKVVEGRLGTGRLIMTDDDGYEIYDSTKDGYSVYHMYPSEHGAVTGNFGRCIDAEDAKDWEVLSVPDHDPLAVTKPMRARKPKK